MEGKFVDSYSQHTSTSPAKVSEAVTERLSTSVLEAAARNKSDLICFSHLRWDWVYQRPQHLLKRAAADRRVFYFEEPICDNGSLRLEVGERDGGVKVVTPYLPKGLCSQIAKTAVLSDMIERFFSEQGIRDYVLWYYTPMAIEFTRQLKPLAVVYDCMDELSAFKGAPEALKFHELELLKRADCVFTGGQSLYEAKREKHRSVHAFPSSIDRDHFMQARTRGEDPGDQKRIAHPRLGFFGVIDERFDTDLLDAVAAARPHWQFVMLGPITKIDPALLPQRLNIHYLGAKSYEELPEYIAGWDVALLPFAINEATRYISPTKTPEYLAAGKPVVSTPITDVIRPYGEMDFVRIAGTPEEFIAAIEDSLTPEATGKEWLERVDKFLAQTSWDQTWAGMSDLIERSIHLSRKQNVKAYSRSAHDAAVATNAA
ncbi:MAG TPA: glycosyltransferase family 1 protein [Pyrinomonadaceae bacterium]|jgi:glycosyltransferase involved in cell wall biosynthesis|nr:glycosyltransferase family 1 protein [Pyrinomonadaceae bacterium]